MEGVNNAFCMSKEEYELARLATKCAGLQGKIDDQSAEIARINGEYQEACRLVAQMHLSAVGGVVGPKLGVVEDVVALKESHDKYKSLCDQMAYAMEMHGAPFLHHELRYNEALEAWRAMK